MHYLKSLSLLFLLLLLPFATGLRAQDDSEVSTYYQVTKLNDPNGNLMEAHRLIMAPYFQERVNRGEIAWHGMYRVKYPRSTHEGFDYVAVAITTDFANLDLDNEDEVLQAALPDASPAKMWKKVRAESDIYSSEVFVGIDGFSAPADGPSKFVKVNYMDVKPSKAGEYVKLESDLWKPVHAAQIKKGALNDWLLVERIMPGGTDFGPGFITVDGFSDWAQIEKNNREMYASAESVYPGEDLEKKLGKIGEVRTMTRGEMWELVSSTVPASKEKEVVTVTEKGSGPAPMKGQRVAFNLNVTKKDGTFLYGNQQLLGIPMEAVLGSDPYNTFMSKYLTQIGMGGKLTVTIPVALQDQGGRQWTGNQDMVLKYELLEVGLPAIDGASTLKEMIHTEGLAAAKAWHKKASSEMAEKYAFTEFTMNALGYDLMGTGHNEEALYVLAENQRANPESYNAHDSLADAYHAMGNDVMAAKHYDRALKINPEASASKEKLMSLRK